MSSVIEVKNLTKKYRKFTAVENLSFSSEKSKVIGIVGPNGAGKTTAIKMILGLSTPTSGEILINGIDLKSDYEKAIRRVSGIVEVPAFYPNLSGYTNLTLTANTYGIHDKKHIDGLVDMLGLSLRINDKVKKYSLGMRQRLGICRALINKPNLLVLDEPLNGLDPDGIIQFRNIISTVKRENEACILISSHILSEIEKVSDRNIFIMNGKEIHIQDQKLDSLTATYKIKCKDATAVSNFLSLNEQLNLISVKTSGEFAIINGDEDTLKSAIIKLLQTDFVISGYEKAEVSLEDTYLMLSRESNKRDDLEKKANFITANGVTK